MPKAFVPAALVAACLGACGGDSTRYRYVLTIPSGDPEAIELCRSPETFAKDEPAEKTQPECAPYGGGDLADGTLSVVVTGADKDAQYALVSEREVVSGVSDPGDFFRLVFRNAFGLAGDTVSGLLASVPKTDALADVTRSLKETLAAQLPPELVATARAAAVPTVEETFEPKALFAVYAPVGAGGKPTLTEPAPDAAVPTVLGIRIDAPPPARMQRWTAERELDYLAGVTADALADHVVKHCAPPKFGPSANDPVGTDVTGGIEWSKYIATERLSDRDIAEALGFGDIESVTAALKGRRGLDISAEIDAAIEADDRTKAQRNLIYLALSVQIHEQASTCRHNAQLVATRAGLSTAKKKNLEEIIVGLDKMVADSRDVRDVFKRFIEPFLVASVVQTVAGVVNGDKVSFGPLAVESGKTKIKIRRARGGQETDIASVDVNGSSSWMGFGIALSFGVAVSWGDTSTIVENVEPSSGDAPRRVVREERQSTVFEPVALGQIDFIDHKRVAVGLVLGVPLTDIPGRHNGVLLGVGIRLRNLGHLAIGAELYQTDDLPGPDGGEEIVVLSDQGNEALTAGQVAHKQQEAAFVIAIALAKDLL